LNPKFAYRFAQTIRRSKTDAADAEVLAEYARWMPFTAWVAPSLGLMRLRSIVRHVESLSVQSAQNHNRLHAAQGSTSTPGCILQDLKRSVASLELRIHKLLREAMTLVRQDDLLRKRFELLVSIPDIAQVSAMQLLPELSTSHAEPTEALRGANREVGGGRHWAQKALVIAQAAVSLVLLSAATMLGGQPAQSGAPEFWVRSGWPLHSLHQFPIVEQEP